MKRAASAGSHHASQTQLSAASGPCHQHGHAPSQPSARGQANQQPAAEGGADHRPQPHHQRSRGFKMGRAGGIRHVPDAVQISSASPLLGELADRQGTTSPGQSRPRVDESTSSSRGFTGGPAAAGRRGGHRASPVAAIAARCNHKQRNHQRDRRGDLTRVSQCPSRVAGCALIGPIRLRCWGSRRNLRAERVDPERAVSGSAPGCRGRGRQVRGSTPGPS